MRVRVCVLVYVCVCTSRLTSLALLSQLVDLIVDVLFWADVVVSFRTTVMRVDGSEEDDPKKMCARARECVRARVC